MSSGVHRARLACVECTRRKVKCDKILPCRNCTRKGSRCTRPRERDSPNPSISQFEGRSQREIPSQTNVDASRTIEILQNRVAQLEASLSEARDSLLRPRIPALDADIHDASFSPAETVSVDRLTAPSHYSVHVESETDPKEVEDAATILEFLAWGRRKDPTYQDEIVRRNNLDHSPGDVPADDEWDDMQMPGPPVAALCQALLPTRQKVYQLAKYHCECLLWYHGAFHAATFLQELDEFYEKSNGMVGDPEVNLQWISFLFAVLTGSMACAPRSTAQEWGFRERERDTLSKRWLKASITCLYQADYMANHSIYSLEAIASLTISAHMLGHSNGFSVLLASAVRIAQGLGLHQLGSDDVSHPIDSVKREIGRRIWCQLCLQDWFSIPFTESYLIHRSCFSTERPLNCDDEIKDLSENHPTVTSHSRLKYKIAALMPDLQDDITSCNTLYTRYEEVLKYDRRLRILATQHLPYYLQNVPLDPSWPCYVKWARRSLAISSSHKVIMIHRKFLSLSFVNPMFEFTRKTCVAASRTIIKEQKEATRNGGPMIWIHQAFSVTASIILCLDMFHQPRQDRQASEHRQLIEDGIEILSHCDTDMIARRGVSLLRAMLEAEQNQHRERRVVGEPPESPFIQDSTPRETGLDIAAIIQTFYRQNRARIAGHCRPALGRSFLPRTTGQSGWPGVSKDISGIMPSVDLMMPLGIDYADGLDDILSLATNYLN
ncbi:hypothetical protein PMG11_09773 [Penicillium brasilianum]|uniref:Zn(2)-C6 fungal-type domain-containing protein n=1 Tax=Penicillium brasilianum TaxID=104259 RepID=A0A0F7TZ68_PENBI|nr:hypothetical protein PMG11_09773 [Penicillium brasilianum]